MQESFTGEVKWVETVSSASSTVKQRGQSSIDTGTESRYGKRHEFRVTEMEAEDRRYNDETRSTISRLSMIYITEVVQIVLLEWGTFHI
jgi:hypothetical protein